MYEIRPGKRSGAVKIPASKSQAHRYLICAALSEKECLIGCDGVSADILATINCLKGLGAGIERLEADEYSQRAVTLKCSPIKRDAKLEDLVLDCGESGSTLRFMLPIVCALGASGHFVLHGRLPERPLAPLDGELRKHGAQIELVGNELHFGGKLRAGAYTMPGSVSSQFISGLLFALPLLSDDSSLTVTGRIESRDYIIMTEEALERAKVRIEKNINVYGIPKAQSFQMPDTNVEGDFSNAAFFLCAGAFTEEGLKVMGLNMASRQGDRRIVEILEAFGAKTERGLDRVTVRTGTLEGLTVDAAMIPDLVPVISVVAAAAKGTTRIVNAGRLRIKESDRIKSTADMINALGGKAVETEDGLVIEGTGLKGGTVDTCNDHRIAMSAAVAACICEDKVVLNDEKCVAKSYPDFFEDFNKLKID